ncbi:MAG: hypothetical protein R3B09_09875 [Nannocystaceae bacterium]
MRRPLAALAPTLALVVGCLHGAPLQDEAPPGEGPPPGPATTEEAAATSGPRECPPPHQGARLRVAGDLVSRTITEWEGVRSLTPTNAHPDLPARATGVLWSVAYFNGDGAPGCAAPASDPRDEYNFSRDLAPSYALYFPSQGEGFNFLREWQVPLPDGGVARLDAAMLGPRSGAGRCLQACAHLVRVEVNGGRGGRGLHFVATDVEVIDASEPLSIPAVVDDLKARFVDQQRGEERELRRRFADAERTIDRAIKPGERVDGPLRVWMTWLAEAAALEVVITREGRAHGERRTGTETIPPTRCPPGAPCAHRESGTFELVDEATIRSEVAARYRVDRSGALVEETRYAAKVTASSGTERRRLR